MAPGQQVYALAEDGNSLRQGEIISGLVRGRQALDSFSNEVPEFLFEAHPYAIILSQDCDLEQDWKRRQEQGLAEIQAPSLPEILFAQLVTARELRSKGLTSEAWRRIKINKDERYQFLEQAPQESDAQGQGLPEFGIDFKRYFTIPTAEVYKQIELDARRRCRLLSPYLEHLSTRFCFYQFRVALPEDHRSVSD